MAVDRTQQRVDVDEGTLVDAGQQRRARRQRHQMLARHRGDLVGVPEGELAQEDPQCRGGIHLVEYPWCATGTQHARIIDAVRAAGHRSDNRRQLPDRVPAPDFTRVDGRSTCSPINRERPVCSASSSTGTNPAADTRFCSSNTADPAVNV